MKILFICHIAKGSISGVFGHKAIKEGPQKLLANRVAGRKTVLTALPCLPNYWKDSTKHLLPKQVYFNLQRRKSNQV